MKLPGGRNAVLIGGLSLVTAGAVVWSVTGSSGAPTTATPTTGAHASTTSPGQSAGTPSGPGASPAPPVLATLAPDAPRPSQTGLGTALEALLRQTDLGPHVGATVVDVASGDVLFGQNADTAFTPASSVKLLTAAAALDTLGPDFRIVTKVVSGAAGQVVLVGGGDPTLSTTAPPVGFSPAPASMAGLARSTAAALKAKHVTSVRVGYDTSAFSGPRTAPTWPASYVTSGIVSPVTALAVDEGRIGPIIEGTGPRVVDPPTSAARSFVQLLRADGITVTGTPTLVKAPSTSATLASVQSPQLSDLVGWMLSMSDNDLAEAVGHLLGKTVGQPTFAGGAQVVRAEAQKLGLDVSGLALFDGSGLTGATKASPADLAGVLSAAAQPDHAALRPILSGLSVSGFTGTLEQRFQDAGTRAAAGYVRAKTGTLRTVGALAGTTVDADGRVLAFAFLADEVPGGGTLDGRSALDRIAARLVGCGCR